MNEDRSGLGADKRAGNLVLTVGYFAEQNGRHTGGVGTDLVVDRLEKGWVGEGSGGPDKI